MLRTFSDDLHAMASQSGSSGLAADVSRQAAGKVRTISSSLDGRDPGELLQDLRGFARRVRGCSCRGADRLVWWQVCLPVGPALAPARRRGDEVLVAR